MTRLALTEPLPSKNLLFGQACPRIFLHLGGNQNKHGQLGPTIGGLKQEP
jgi:hypothetical protein